MHVFRARFLLSPESSRHYEQTTSRPVRLIHESRFWLAYALLAPLTFAVGCGGGPHTVSVSGRVAYRGEPVNSGAVTFFPATGRQVIAPISNGQYRTDLPPGDYTVVINVSTELPPGFKEGDPLPPAKIVLPAEYATRAKSTLSAEVGESGSQEVNFELK
jgi:hypothetical protein